MTFEEEFRLKTEEIESIVTKYLPKEEGLQKTVFSASNYGVLGGGKRLRPMLMLETYRLFDGKSREIEPFVAAIEYIHSSSLIHDDLPSMDNDEYRRGKKSTWAAYGEAMGVLAGDALLMYAVETACKAFSLSVNPKNVGKAIEVLASKTGVYGMIGGQTVDVEKTGQPLTEEELDFIYRLKTGALIEASMMIGAILADASQEDIKNTGEIASCIGYAFQIQDDILDVISTDEILGKPVHSDERNEKTTYVSIHGIEKSREKVEELLNRAVSLLSGLSGENRFLEQLIISLITREK